jgi:L-arabinose isomerase
MLMALKKKRNIYSNQINTKLGLIMNNLTKNLKDKDGKISQIIDKINEIDIIIIIIIMMVTIVIVINKIIITIINTIMGIL